MSARRSGWSRRRFLFGGLAIALAGLAGGRVARRGAAGGGRGAPAPGDRRRRARVRAELGRGETVVVGGWLLSRTEAALAARRGEPGAPVPESPP